MKNNEVKIVFISLEYTLLNSYAEQLSNENFNVKCIEQKEQIEDTLNEFKPDIIFLDVVYHNFDGVEFCMELRKKPKYNPLLIVFFTDKKEAFTKIACLDAGADDIINIPIKQLVLSKKIQSYLRFKKIQASVKIPNQLFIDRNNYLVIKDNNKINIPKKEFEILLLLSTNPERVYTMEEIYNKIWGFDSMVNFKSIPVYIKKIRNKIGNEHIITIKGIGYKFSYANNSDS